MLATEIPKPARVRSALSKKIPVKAEECRRSFFYFMKEFWDEVAVDKPVWNWHVPYLCGQLSVLATRVSLNLPKQYDLIINIPPGTTKSITCSVMFEPWCWIKWHWMRFITASYSGQLALELAENSRDLVRSDKFQNYFPELRIKQDKDTKSNFRVEYLVFDKNYNVVEVKRGGNRYSTSVGGTLTGFHGHINLVDDPLDPKRAASEQELKNANFWMDQTLSTRKANKEVTPLILIMQRLHQNDPTGNIKSKQGKKLFHICLPGELRNYGDKVNPSELKDYYTDGFLDARRMNQAVLDELMADLGQYGYAGQVGQDPTPPGGGMFHPDKMEVLSHMPDPALATKKVIYWDKAGTQGGGAYTCGTEMWEMLPGRFPYRYVIVRVDRGQWGTHEREEVIKRRAESSDPDTTIIVEQEPGSGGKESAERTIANLTGHSVRADRPTGDKMYRADPFSVQVNWGNVAVVDGPWVKPLKDEMRPYPYSTYKDQIDSCSGAYNYLSGKKQAGPLLGSKRR